MGVNAVPGSANISVQSPMPGARGARVLDLPLQYVGAAVFPVSISGSIHLKLDAAPSEMTAKVAVDRIVDMLDLAGAAGVRTEGNRVLFWVGWFRPVWNWNILVPFNSGHIEVWSRGKALSVSYTLSVLRMFLVVTLLLAALMTFVVLGKADPMAQVQATLPWVGVAWLWLFGLNYLIATIRFPLWLRRGMRKSPQLERRQSA